MPLSIKNPETEKLARQLARRTGKSITDAVTEALRDRLRVVEAQKRGLSLQERIQPILDRIDAMPDRDMRSLEEILYDEDGLPR